MLAKNMVDEPRGNVVFRQELVSITPSFGPKCAILCNIILAVLFVAFGVPIVIAQNNTFELKIDYTNCTQTICDLQFKLIENVSGPFFVYYELNNYYVNHKDYSTSRSYPQLRGELHIDSNNNSKVCAGAQYVWQMFNNDSTKYKTHWNQTLDPYDFANPCGIVAKTFFNDTFKLVSDNMNEININQTNIANDYDKSYMFKRHENHTKLQWIDVEDEHFIVWMQMESFADFRKLWGKIFNRTLTKGDYHFIVENNYNVSMYNARKSVVLTTSSALGTSSFFGYTLILAGMYCLGVFLILLFLFIRNRGKRYEYSELKWN